MTLAERIINSLGLVVLYVLSRSTAKVGLEDLLSLKSLSSISRQRETDGLIRKL